jgi:hypothetical protein
LGVGFTGMTYTYATWRYTSSKSGVKIAGE